MRYTIRKSPTGSRRGFVYSLTVPPTIAEQVPKDVRFRCEVTDEGILYRAMRNEDPEPSAVPPKWAI